jgi:polyhydroxyalkanoate synthesis regulator phasin
VLYTEKETGDELLGFIAHEVQDVIPEAVEGEKDGVDENGDPTIQNLYPAKFIVYLVGAVKELTARVAELEEKVATLESRP